jgi:hypothetical protein
MTKTMAVGLIVSFVLVFGVALVPPLQAMFDLATLPVWLYFVAMILAFVPTIMFELARVLANKNKTHLSQSDKA